MLCWNSSPGMAKRVPDEGILLTNIMAFFIQQWSLLMTPFLTVAVQQSNTPFSYAFWQTTGINFEAQSPWDFRVEHPFYENHTSYMIVSLLRTEESPSHLLNLWAVPVIFGRDSWLRQLRWPWSSSWCQWVEVSTASSCATDLEVRFAQCWGDPKLQSSQSDTCGHPRPELYLGMGEPADGKLHTWVGRWIQGKIGDVLLPWLNWALLTQQEIMSRAWLCHSTTCKNMLYYRGSVAELGKGVANCDKVHAVLWEGI